MEDSDTRSVKVTVLEENNKDEDGYSDVSQEFSDDELEEEPGSDGLDEVQREKSPSESASEDNIIETDE